MIEFLKDLTRILGRHTRALLMFIGIVVVVLVAAAMFLKYETTRASFCGSCHFMEPYIRHWDASSHADVECVKCHDYGVLALTGSALRYMTGTHDNRPKANVHDESCLAAGCHEVESLSDMKEYDRGIMFDHSAHRDQRLRGEKLRCTSCHNRIVQTDEESQQHMTVNNKACFICHFKDAGAGEAITGCNSCHGIPTKEVQHAGFAFDHKPYLKLEVECKQCHTKIVRGDGSVPSEKCYSCHTERQREEHTRQELHDIHITENGIDCYRCHSEIEHGNFSMVGALEEDCESCHLRQHNRPKQLYMGIGGKDTLDVPSGMFTAQVSCTGCHTHVTPEGEILADQEKKEATRNSCVTCHGDGYEKMFDNWLAGSKKVLDDYGRFLKTASAEVISIGGSKKAKTAVRAALSRAEFNYHFVQDAKMAHNIHYSVYLLNASADSFVEEMKKINKGYRPPPRGEGLQNNKVCMTFCHGQGLTPETVRYQGDDLPHLMHIEDLEVGCENCHSTKEHGVTVINENKCSECH